MFEFRVCCGIEETYKSESSYFWKQSRRRGRGKDGSEVIDDQSLDTQLNLATDFSGSLESISMVRSVGIDCVLPFR